MEADETIIKKAYEIDLNQLNDGYLSGTIMCHENTTNKARITLLKAIRYDDYTLRKNNKPVTYLNLPVKRRKSWDKVWFQNKEVFRYQIEEIKDEAERIAKLDEILNNPHIEYCYIIKGSYYRPNWCGYTSRKVEAGIYTKPEAVQHAKSVREIRLERVDKDEHNKRIIEKIAELESILIQ